MDESTATPSPPSPLPHGAGEARLQLAPDHAEQALADLVDDAVPSRSYDMLPMVGLGGSAGALAALQGFFTSAPTDSGMAFVVVMHLSADHESALAQILQRATSMPVLQVNETARVEANHVYVIPPGKTLTSANGHLTCAALTPDHGRRVAVDLFFRTLADTHGPHAAAIVLSGADGDGAIGIKRIKERGGLTIAQDPDEAEQSGMPRSAIATGMVDWILRVGDMPSRLVAYTQVLGRLKLPPEDGPQPAQAAPAPADDLEAVLREVLKYLRASTGRDFTYYKRATILRRLGRRMSVNGIDDLPTYLAFMRTHPGESGALLKDLLISVTNFFRDRDAFDALQAQMTALFAGKGANDEVRVWVPACATGEEAYSIAMLLAEHARVLEVSPTLQVFATDLDDDAIRAAREGIYPPAIAADVSEERLRRYFTRELRGFRVRAELREAVVFASHDLLKDAPFSRLDLVSCRNLFIYLNTQAQQRALEIVHFALRPHGRLFLGVSETVDVSPHLFQPIDSKHRIFESRIVRDRRLPPPVGGGVLARSLALPLTGPAPMSGRLGAFLTSRPNAEDLGVGSWRELHLKLIERFAPASVIITADYEMVHISERAGRYLRHSGGEPSNNLLLAVEPSLTGDLRTALLRAHESDVPVETAPLAFDSDADEPALVIRVGRAEDLAAGFLLVTFEPVSPEVAPRPPSTTPEGDAHLHRLQQQVDELKWHLRDATEQGAFTAQELKASNEELQAMNEELRSATEELETSREELQSINEELTTVNQELKAKVDELSHANGDLQNLMAATAIPTVFLDRSLCISMFTPSAVELFNLIGADVGRPISDLANRLDYPQLNADARVVLDKLVPIEREVRFDEHWLLARLRPYRSGEDRISGVVLTFVDISERRRVSEALRESEALFRTIVTQAAAGVAHIDLDGGITLANARFGLIAGRAPEALIGTSAFAIVHPDDRDRNIAAFRRLAVDGTPFEMEKRYVRGDGSVVWVNASVNAVLDAEERPSAAVAIVLDVSDRRHAEQALRESEERLRLIVDSAREYAIVAMDLKRRITGWNSGAESLTGYVADEVIGQSADLIFIEEDRVAGAPQREATLALAEGRAADERWHRRKNGSRFWGSGVMMAMRDGEGANPIGLLKIFRDQTQARASEQALETSRAELVQALVDNRKARAEAEAASHAKDRFLAILSHELRTPLTPVVMALHALERHNDLPASLRGTVELIRRNVRAELMLIDDLLDVTRISSGKLEMTRAQTDMHEVIHAAADVCAGDFMAKRQRVGLALHATRHMVAGDASRLQQVVWNLLKNAAKFTPNEGEIKVVSSNIDNRFVLVVADTGIGIASDALPVIFDAFAQEGPWVTSEFGGLGLGLAIAKATVEAHHGSLVAASSGRNQGATFTIELPLD
ncbi:MAG TPA: chemotaxis protein CheB [Caldimonas sp.]|nr:chemotaxis protein CheB [Caldimonas sp.]HEV7574431.1 chemotaxis protein CheB [Caldimonas sp.]